MSDGDFRPMPKNDAVAWFRCCSECFGELAALFDAIRRQCATGTDLDKLCALGAEVASDHENMADCWREELEQGGFLQ